MIQVNKFESGDSTKESKENEPSVENFEPSEGEKLEQENAELEEKILHYSEFISSINKTIEQDLASLFNDSNESEYEQGVNALRQEKKEIPQTVMRELYKMPPDEVNTYLEQNNLSVQDFIESMKAEDFIHWEVYCGHCGQKGHKSEECPKKMKK